MGDFMNVVLVRVFWGLFLGGLMCFSFHRSWSIEHGKERLNSSDDTVIYMNPAIWPILIVMFFGLSVLSSGLYSGFTVNKIISGCMEFGTIFLQLLIFVNIYFVLLLCFLPVCRKFLYARTCAAMWLIPVLLFYQPHVFMNISFLPFFTLYIPVRVLKIMFFIWAAGFTLFFLGQIMLHFIWRRKLMMSSEPVKDEEIRVLLEMEKEKLGLASTVELRYSRSLETPLSLGMFRRKKYTFLPERDFSEEDLKLVFRHELHHIQRKDMDTKFFLTFCRALGWFHPLVWIAVKKAGQDLELSCDEIVLEQSPKEEKEKYAQLLLSTAGESGGFSTCLSASARTLRYRLRAVQSYGKRKMGLPVLMVLMLVSILLFGSIGLSYERGTLEKLVFHDLVIQNGQKVFVSYESENDEETGFRDNGDEIIAYLKTLEAEHLMTEHELAGIESDPDLNLYFGQTILNISGSQLLVSVEEDRGIVSKDLYQIRSEVDWSYLEGLLE